MITLILIIGCTLFICIGIGFSAWAGAEMQVEGLDLNNIIMFLVGIGIIVFGLFCVDKASSHYKERESPKTEITTSIPPQIDTVITIRSGVSDTTYVYKFNPTEK